MLIEVGKEAEFSCTISTNMPVRFINATVKIPNGTLITVIGTQFICYQDNRGCVQNQNRPNLTHTSNSNTITVRWIDGVTWKTVDGISCADQSWTFQYFGKHIVVHFIIIFTKKRLISTAVLRYSSFIKF